jgi:hypothetical protein
LQEIFVPNELGPGEVLVEMVATGICHTDISLTAKGMGQAFPIVAGHEGELRVSFLPFFGRSGEADGEVWRVERIKKLKSIVCKVWKAVVGG